MNTRFCSVAVGLSLVLASTVLAQKDSVRLLPGIYYLGLDFANTAEEMTRLFGPDYREQMQQSMLERPCWVLGDQIRLPNPPCGPAKYDGTTLQFTLDMARDLINVPLVGKVTAEDRITGTFSGESKGIRGNFTLVRIGPMDADGSWLTPVTVQNALRAKPVAAPVPALDLGSPEAVGKHMLTAIQTCDTALLWACLAPEFRKELMADSGGNENAGRYVVRDAILLPIPDAKSCRIGKIDQQDETHGTVSLAWPTKEPLDSQPAPPGSRIKLAKETDGWKVRAIE